MEDNGDSFEHARVPRFEEVGLDRFTPYLLARIVGRYNTKLAHNAPGKESLTIKMRVLTILADRDLQTVNELAVLAVTKPVVPKELAARIRALLRRVQLQGSSRTTSSVKFGDVELRREEGIVLKAGEELAVRVAQAAHAADVAAGYADRTRPPRAGFDETRPPLRNLPAPPAR